MKEPEAKWATRSELVRSLPKGGVVVELGVFRGIFARDIYEVLEPLHFYMVDLWTGPRQNVWDGVKKDAESKFSYDFNTTIIKGDIHEKASEIPDELMFVHADSGVKYNHISKTMAIYWPKLMFGGHMAIRGYTPTNPVNGVVKAIDETEGVEVVGISDDRNFSRTILLRKSNV